MAMARRSRKVRVLSNRVSDVAIRIDDGGLKINRAALRTIRTLRIRKRILLPKIRIARRINKNRLTGIRHHRAESKP
jgi:hypothetical protein